jgi:CRP-like cAMP-binding protein
MMTVARSDLHSLVTQLDLIFDLSKDDRAAIESLPVRTKMVGERRDVIREGVVPTECCIVVGGMLCRYKMLSNGRRQILSFHFPGDMPDLQSLHLKTMDHSVATITESRLAFVPHDVVRRLIRTRPGVADALMQHLLVDAAIYREWIANVGRRTALERVAHLLCECFVRMSELGIVKQSTFELPLTQAEIGDATGLSNVHVNRTLKELRRLGLIATNGKVHAILDWEMLRDAAGYDSAYLHLRRKMLAPSV